jgi:hypothetical protein
LDSAQNKNRKTADQWRDRKRTIEKPFLMIEKEVTTFNSAMALATSFLDIGLSGSFPN